MNKIVVERERWGSSRPSRKWGRRLPFIPGFDYEDEPKRVSSSRHRQYVDPRSFTDVLNPVEGFLRKNIGRIWDDIYSKLRSGLDVRKVTGRHVFQHLGWMVDQNCFEDKDGRIRSYRLGFKSTQYPPVRGFYVHPRTGLLQYAQRRSTSELRRETLQNRRVEGFWIDRTHAYRILDGVWYIVTYERIFVPLEKDAHNPRHVWDALRRGKVQLRAGSNLVAVRKKQCSRKEIARIQDLVAEWQRSLRQHSFKPRDNLAVILGTCPVCKANCDGRFCVPWSF